ncbi:hypothetical protein Tco_1538641, partial [Tanacetum coccineum]
RNAIRANYSNEYVASPSLTDHGVHRLGGKRGGLDQFLNKDVTILYCLANGVKVDFARLISEDILHKLNKKIKEKIVLYPRFISLLLEYMMPYFDHEDLTINPTQVFSLYYWALKPNQPEGPPFTDHIKAICNIDVPVESKAPTTSSKTKMKAKDKSLSHPSTFTPVVDEMHKEAQQAASGPTSLGATSEEGAHPQLSSGTNPSVLVDKTKSTEDGLKTAHTDLGTKEESRSDEILKKIKLEDLSNLMQDTRSAFLTHDSLQDEPIIVLGESKVEETERYEDTHTTFHDGPRDTSIPHPPSPKSVEQQKAKAEAEIAFLKARPSYPDINQLTELLVIDTLNRFATIIENASTKATDKGIPIVGYASASLAEEEKNINQATKDADNSKGKEVMSSKDAKDEETESNSKDDHANPAETMTESSKQKKLKKFSFVTEGGEQIHLTAKKIEEQKRIEKSLKGELAKQEVEKGPITLKVYREDGTNEVISNLKVIDLHLAEIGVERQFEDGPVPEPFSLSLDLNIKSNKYSQVEDSSACVAEETLASVLRFILVDNSKLNNVYLLNRRLKQKVSLLEGLQGGKKIALRQKE